MKYWPTILFAVSAVTLAAQATFEVVSIRRNTSEIPGGTMLIRPGGRWVASNVPPKALIMSGWEIDRVVGGPAWTETDRYDVEAITGSENTPRERVREMIRSMLRDRFKLVAHVDKRELPVYHLIRVRPDGQLGPKIRRTNVDCLDPTARKQAIAEASARGRVACGITFEAGRYRVGGSAITALESLLSSPAGRPVLDRTGLTGTYDFELEWTSLGAGTSAADSVSIFTAVQEQLGLKLENATAPLDVVVIDRIERPSEN